MSELFPKDWKPVLLDKVVKSGQIILGRGNVISKIDIRENSGAFPIYSSSAKNNGLMGCYGSFMFDEELISWSVDGGGALFYRPKHKFSVTNVCGYMRVCDDNIDCKFLHYILSYQHERLSFDYQSKAHPSVIRDLYYVVQIPLPEQKKIASILTSVDEAIEKQEAQISKLQDLKKAMMQELLTKGIGHIEFKDSLVGRIPVGWEVKGLGEVCSFTQGVQITADNMKRELETGYIRYIYIRDFTIDNRQWFVEDKYPNKIITDVDIAMANTGHSSGTVYKGKYGVLSNNAFKISFSQDVFCTEFLFSFLQSEFFLRKIQQLFNTAGQPHVGHGNIAKMPTPVPNIKEQQKISSILMSMDDNIQSKQKKLAHCKSLKKSLMQDLLTGKVRVNVQ